MLDPLDNAFVIGVLKIIITILYQSSIKSQQYKKGRENYHIWRCSRKLCYKTVRRAVCRHTSEYVKLDKRRQHIVTQQILRMCFLEDVFHSYCTPVIIQYVLIISALLLKIILIMYNEYFIKLITLQNLYD